MNTALCMTRYLVKMRVNFNHNVLKLIHCLQRIFLYITISVITKLLLYIIFFYMCAFYMIKDCLLKLYVFYAVTILHIKLDNISLKYIQFQIIYNTFLCSKIIVKRHDTMVLEFVGNAQPYCCKKGPEDRYIYYYIQYGIMNNGEIQMTL